MRTKMNLAGRGRVVMVGLALALVAGGCKHPGEDPGSTGDSGGTGGSGGMGGSGGAGGGEDNALLLEPRAGSCEILWIAGGKTASEGLGNNVVGVGDVNGDGLRDLVVSRNQGKATALVVLSGKDGTRLGETVLGGSAYVRAVGGDFDGDGVEEVAAHERVCEEDDGGSSGGSSSPLACATNVRVFSPKGFEERFTRLGQGTPAGDGLGHGITLAEDRNGDGKPDFFVGSSGFSMQLPGWVELSSGADASVFAKPETPAEASPVYGANLATVPDADGDGLRELLVGDVYAANFKGRVQAIGSLAGDPLWTYVGEAGSQGGTPDLIGNPLSTHGDVNADGYPDVIVGAHNHASLVPNGGRVVALDGRTGDALWTSKGDRADDHLGVALASADDVNGDGVPDVIAGANGVSLDIVVLGMTGRVAVLSGKDGAVLIDVVHVLPPDNVGIYGFGTGVALLGDLDGDGKGEIAVSAPGAPFDGHAGAGQVMALHCTP
ncbi:VCBS repeat-containing protein [Polyangium mundeleinium]|uniref:VCBS repeat-containing protein n=1 Tax=Polyangium mundeleinium TaxID=2995306 RepID=A0ABT5EXP6_9BACT|nr:VCBS repeat-containing protein [Polyangium mundeleinium]MDC0746129.1 VCBS repeat-containing protein [Polyangium mundeleinium]